jgi:hypothetical protein
MCGHRLHGQAQLTVAQRHPPTHILLEHYLDIWTSGQSCVSNTTAHSWVLSSAFEMRESTSASCKAASNHTPTVTARRE